MEGAVLKKYFHTLSSGIVTFFLLFIIFQLNKCWSVSLVQVRSSSASQPQILGRVQTSTQLFKVVSFFGFIGFRIAAHTFQFVLINNRLYFYVLFLSYQDFNLLVVLALENLLISDDMIKIRVSFDYFHVPY